MSNQTICNVFFAVCDRHGVGRSQVGCDDDARDGSVRVNRKARFGKQAKRSVHTTLRHTALSLPNALAPVSTVNTNLDNLISTCSPFHIMLMPASSIILSLDTMGSATPGQSANVLDLRHCVLYLVS
jgi:hypothetical protein